MEERQTSTGLSLLKGNCRESQEVSEKSLFSMKTCSKTRQEEFCQTITESESKFQEVNSCMTGGFKHSFIGRSSTVLKRTFWVEIAARKSLLNLRIRQEKIQSWCCGSINLHSRLIKHPADQTPNYYRLLYIVFHEKSFFCSRYELKHQHRIGKYPRLGFPLTNLQPYLNPAFEKLAGVPLTQTCTMLKACSAAMSGNECISCNTSIPTAFWDADGFA